MRRVLPYLACALVTACVQTTEPELSAPTAWEIQPAAAMDDGTAYWPGTRWRTALPAQAGMDSAAMASLSRDLRARRWPTLRSLLVVRHGYLVFNEYADDATPQALQPLQSMTATVTGLLVGIAMREGKLRPTDGVPQLFPEYADLFSGSFKNGMVVDHLLTMRSGLAFNEEDASGVSLQGPMRSSGDWLRYILEAPMSADVGERWSYSSGDAIALGGAIRAGTGEAANDYARRTLFAPLGITDYTWLTGHPNGLPQMGDGLSLTAPDMARLGYLMLRKGRWGDAAIVTPEWVARMGERKSLDVVHWLRYSLDFGRMLWELPVSTTGDDDMFAAAGVGGQWIIVVPSRDIVVVATGDALSVEKHATALQLLYDVILPAAH